MNTDASWESRSRFLCKPVWNKVGTPAKLQPTVKVGLVQLSFKVQPIHTSDGKVCALVTTEPGTLHLFRVSSRTGWPGAMVGCLLVCLTSQQQASVSQGRICSDSFTCCHTEIEAADQTFYLAQSQYTDTGPTSPSADPVTPGAWQGSPLECQFWSHWYDSTPEKIPAQAGFEPGTFHSRGGRLNH